MKDEYTYTQLAPHPLPLKGEGKSTKFKNIYDKSSFPSYHYTLSARPAMV